VISCCLQRAAYSSSSPPGDMHARVASGRGVRRF
jgi:hypothetical protein